MNLDVLRDQREMPMFSWILSGDSEPQSLRTTGARSTGKICGKTVASLDFRDFFIFFFLSFSVFFRMIFPSFFIIFDFFCLRFFSFSFLFKVLYIRAGQR